MLTLDTWGPRTRRVGKPPGRKHLGFTKTTASMLNLATLSLDAMMAKDDLRAVSCWAQATWVEKPWKPCLSARSRSPWSAGIRNGLDRFGSDGGNVDFIDFEAWTNNLPSLPHRVHHARGHPRVRTEHRLPTTEPLTVMDFSWPPSIDADGLHPGQTLLGMNHWIQKHTASMLPWTGPPFCWRHGRSCPVCSNSWTGVWLRPRKVISEASSTKPSHGWPRVGPPPR